jgi:diguanylate cyclase (GGDEF)-like protein
MSMTSSDRLTPVPRLQGLEVLEAPLSIDSPLYVGRPPIERQALEQLQQPGALIRIRAPQKMGKTSLVLRLLHQAERLRYLVAVIDFRRAEPAVLADTSRLLRWLCTDVGRQLGLPNRLEEHWLPEIGSLLSATLYFQTQILRVFDAPLVLCLREVDALFAYPAVTQAFFSLLRSWFEEARLMPLWQHLRLLLIHATEAYVPLQVHQSPFNVGLCLRLPEFTLAQVQTLSQRYGLTLLPGQMQSLVNLVGGHPYLLAISLSALTTHTLTWEQFQAQATASSGPYGNHLRGYWELIKTNPQLCSAFRQVVSSDAGAVLEAVTGYQLESIGLVRLEGEYAVVSCNLYRQYFSTQFQRDNVINLPLANPAWHTLHQRLQVLEYETHALQQALRVDSVTQFLKRQPFREYLEQAWQTAQALQEPLTLILCSIDYLSVYLEAYGHDQGDACIQQIANVIRNCVAQPGHQFARQSLDEILILLPQTPLDQAYDLAESIRVTVEALELEHDPQYLGLPLPVVTVTCGVAAGIPAAEVLPSMGLQLADQALKQAARAGRNRVRGLNLEALPAETDIAGTEPAEVKTPAQEQPYNGLARSS